MGAIKSLVEGEVYIKHIQDTLSEENTFDQELEGPSGRYESIKLAVGVLAFAVFAGIIIINLSSEV